MQDCATEIYLAVPFGKVELLKYIRQNKDDFFQLTKTKI